MPKHAERAHALLSPSAAERWMHCTPSARLTENMPDTRTAFSDEGTRAHELAEKLLTTYLSKGRAAMNRAVKKADPEIWSGLSPYIEHVIDTYEDMKSVHEDAVMFVETKLSMEQWVQDCFGTADCIIIGGDTIMVIDLKFGKGVPVTAVNNPQARLYALGALYAYGVIYEPQTVITRIDQPRLDSITEETISVADLLKWAEDELKPAAVKAYNGTGTYTAGDWCKFCKAKATCPHRASAVFEIEPVMNKVPDVNLLTPAQISDTLTRATALESYVKALQDHVMDLLLNGQDVPGWKLVEGRAVRRWADDAAVAQRLRDAGIDDALIYKKTLHGLTEVQKILGGKKKFDELLDDLVIRPEGKPTLAPDTDPRPAINATTDVFDAIEIDE